MFPGFSLFAPAVVVPALVVSRAPVPERTVLKDPPRERRVVAEAVKALEA
jgi:hypothetical protein